MKKLSAAAFAFGLLSVSVSQALAADATVNFSGTILQEACSVDTSDNTVNVQLGTYGAAQFPRLQVLRQSAVRFDNRAIQVDQPGT